MVLNAFRHQRFNTLSAANRALTFGSAQRLSASEIQHFMAQPIANTLGECSTPFGIRDSTRKSGEIPTDFYYGAQRFSASEIQHAATH